MKTKIYANFIKRPLDFLGASLLILFLLPVYIVLAIVIRIDMGSPIIFRQARPGRDEKIFYVFKFRSMNSKTDENGNLLPDLQRLTALGKLIRKTSLDELPQFFNVLRGDMSFIGPRPLLPQYLQYYSPTEHKRHSVRPGITGLAQVNGRNNLSWNNKLAYDVEYAENITFWGDVLICIKTIQKVFCCSGVKTGAELPFDVERKAELQTAEKATQNADK